MGEGRIWRELSLICRCRGVYEGASGASFGRDMRSKRSFVPLDLNLLV